MSKPDKPWRQCVAAHPADATTVWIRLQAGIGQPVQAFFNESEQNFYVSIPAPDTSDPITIVYRYQEVWAWRDL